jgi:hypothetical protein
MQSLEGEVDRYCGFCITFSLLFTIKYIYTVLQYPANPYLIGRVLHQR